MHTKKVETFNKVRQDVFFACLCVCTNCCVQVFVCFPYLMICCCAFSLLGLSGGKLTCQSVCVYSLISMRGCSVSTHLNSQGVMQDQATRSALPFCHQCHVCVCVCYPVCTEMLAEAELSVWKVVTSKSFEVSLLSAPPCHPSSIRPVSLAYLAPSPLSSILPFLSPPLYLTFPFPAVATSSTPPGFARLSTHRLETMSDMETSVHSIFTCVCVCVRYLLH